MTDPTEPEDVPFDDSGEDLANEEDGVVPAAPDEDAEDDDGLGEDIDEALYEPAVPAEPEPGSDPDEEGAEDRE